MLDFIRQLKAGYQRVALSLQDADKRHLYELRIASLQIAEAALMKQALREKDASGVLQLALLGPTQAGKSTTVNLLLREDQAGVSPLAGYTVHPQGFALGVADAQIDWLNQYFAGFAKAEAGARGEADDNSFTLLNLAKDKLPTLPAAVVWDTPDFDSLGASRYQEGVLRTAALADVILLVLSKDKYADQSVWDMMRLLEPLGSPTLVCLNKVTDDSQDVLTRSLKEKWQHVRADKPLAVVAMPYVKEGLSVAVVEAQLKQLTDTITSAAKSINVKTQHKNTQAFLKTHWDEWLQPVIAEQQAHQQWQALLQQYSEDALNFYQRDYLNHPQHYETFNKALAELLTLLELPGVSKVLAGFRKVVTWPVRTVFRIGKSAVTDVDEGPDSLETRILGQVSDHFFVQLAESLLKRADEDPDRAEFWRAMNRQLRAEKDAIVGRFVDAIREYHVTFQDEIHASAYGLYNKLEEHPATLNSLRTTRVATDAAALAIALHTGGIGVQDFIIAPAVLSMTSMMTEGALGRHMNGVASKLKRTQREAVREQLFDGILVNALLDLPQRADSNSTFNLSSVALEEASQQLDDKRYGLRIF